MSGLQRDTRNETFPLSSLSAAYTSLWTVFLFKLFKCCWTAVLLDFLQQSKICDLMCQGLSQLFYEGRWFVSVVNTGLELESAN